MIRLKKDKLTTEPEIMTCATNVKSPQMSLHRRLSAIIYFGEFSYLINGFLRAVSKEKSPFAAYRNIDKPPKLYKLAKFS